MNRRCTSTTTMSTAQQRRLKEHPAPNRSSLAKRYRMKLECRPEHNPHEKQQQQQHLKTYREELHIAWLTPSTERKEKRPVREAFLPLVEHRRRPAAETAHRLNPHRAKPGLDIPRDHVSPPPQFLALMATPLALGWVTDSIAAFLDVGAASHHLAKRVGVQCNESKSRIGIDVFPETS